MKTKVLLLLCVCMVLLSSNTAEERIIDTDAELIINGQKVTPPFLVLLNGTGIKVNDIDYPLSERLFVDSNPLPAKDKPALENKEIVDWLLKTAVIMTNECLAKGEKEELIWSKIEKFFEENSDGVIVSATGSKGVYSIKHRDLRLAIGLTLQKEYISFQHISKNRKIKSQYDNLCKMLNKSMFIENTNGFIKASNKKQKVQ